MTASNVYCREGFRGIRFEHKNIKHVFNEICANPPTIEQPNKSSWMKAAANDYVNTQQKLINWTN